MLAFNSYAVIVFWVLFLNNPEGDIQKAKFETKKECKQELKKLNNAYCLKTREIYRHD